MIHLPQDGAGHDASAEAATVPCDARIGEGGTGVAPSINKAQDDFCRNANDLKRL
jgi:hypothetical protein